MGSVGARTLRQQSRSPAVASDFSTVRRQGQGESPGRRVEGHLHQAFAPGDGSGSFFYSFHHPFSSVIDGPSCLRCAEADKTQ